MVFNSEHHTTGDIQMAMTTVRKVSTRQDADSGEKWTQITFDWTGVTEAHYRAMAETYLTIRKQTEWRKKGIPSAVTVKVLDNVPGTRHQMTIEEAFAQMTPEQRQKLIDQYTKAKAA